MLSEIHSIKTKMFKRVYLQGTIGILKEWLQKLHRGERIKNLVPPLTCLLLHNNNNSNSGSGSGDVSSTIKEGNVDQDKGPMTTPNICLTSEDDELPLTEQIEYLYEIQEKLLGQYKKLLRADEKWFVLRELLLDANVELDVFSEEDIKSTLAKKRSRRGNNKDQISQSEQNNENHSLT